ncbi:MAG: LysE family translocator [Anaerolineales bacterium]|nr:LysE family translocator [Anaerolineales bacterium]
MFLEYNPLWDTHFGYRTKTDPYPESEIALHPELFLTGVMFGLSIAAPVGPIGVLCIRRTLVYGRLNGFLSGMGAASADAVYGSIAGFGLTLISSSLMRGQFWLHLLGGLFLVYLGLKTFFAQPGLEAAETNPTSDLAKAYATTFLLTLTNPMTILSFAAIFAGLDVTATAGDYPSAFKLVLGVFTGSALWWGLLSLGIGFLHNKVSPNSLQWINRISGTIITSFGILAFITI